MVKFVDLHAQYRSIKTEIDEAIESVILDSAFIGGKYVAAFERELAAFVGSERCLGLGTGTDVLEIDIEAARLPAGPRIIVPGNSFIATSEASDQERHRVVFADVDRLTLTADTVKARISERTKAIVAVHLYGHPCDMAPLMELARDNGLVMIEGCAQAHGAEYHGRRIGTFGDFATFSSFIRARTSAPMAMPVRDHPRPDMRSWREDRQSGGVAKYDHDRGAIRASTACRRRY